MSLDLSKRFLSFQIIDQQNIGGGGDVTISGSEVLREQIEDVIYDALTAGDNILITYDDIPDPGIIRIATTSSIAVDNVTVGSSTEIGTTGSGIDVIHFTDGVGGILCTDFTISGTEHKVYNAGEWVSYTGPDYWDDSLSGGITWNSGLGQYDISGSFNLYTTGTWPIAFRPTKVRLTISGSPTGYIDFIVKDVHGQTIAIDEDYIGGVVDIAVNQDGDYGWQGADLDQLSYYVDSGIAITNIEFFTTHYTLESSWNTPLDIHANSVTLGEQSVVLKEAAYYSSGSAVTGLGMTSPLMMYNDDGDEAMMWINKGTGNNLFFMDPNSYNTGYPDDTFTGYSNLFFIHGDFENAITAANNNVLLATGNSYLTTGQYNVFLGSGVNRVSTGSYNVFIGNNVGYDTDAAGYIDNSQYNIGIGYRVFYDLYQTMGQYNIAMGYEAGFQMDGIGNVALGYHALRYVSTRNYQVAIGYEAGRSGGGTAGGHGLVAIGHQAGHSTYGEYNIAIGYRSQYQSNQGDYNVTMGYRAGEYLDNDANQNVLIGHYAGGYSSAQSGDYNVGIGPYALYRFSGASYNVAIGYYAGSESYNGDNVFVGAEAGRLSTAVSSCVHIGRRAGYQNDGSSNTAIGYYAGYTGNGIYNVFLGFYAGRLDSGGYNTSVGAYAGEQSGSQSYNTHVGYQAGRYSGAQRNIFVGYSAGRDNDGAQNTAIGYEAGLVGNGTYNVFIGEIAGRNNTGSSNICIGYEAGASADGSNCVFIGRHAGYGNDSSDTVAIGYYAGNLGDGAQNVFVGRAAGEECQGTWNVMLGHSSGADSAGCDYTVMVGHSAGRYNSGDRNILIGQYAGFNPSSDGADNVFIGYSAGYESGSNFSIYIGRHAGYNNDGNNNVFIGYYAGQAATEGANTFVGYQSGYKQTTAEQNVFIGYRTAYGPDKGTPANSDRNTAVGYQAGMRLNAGTDNVFLGHSAGFDTTTGVGNIFIGYRSGLYETGSNKLYISNSDTSTPLIYGEFDTPMVIINGDLTVYGDMTVSGTVTYINTTELEIGDNIIRLNADWPMMAPSESAGIEIERGTSTDSRILWDETDDLWKAGLAGSEVEISLLGHTHSEYLNKDGSVQLTGDWDFGSYTISGTGDIHCNDLYTAASGIYIGDLHLSYSGTHLIVPAELQVDGDIGTNSNIYCGDLYVGGDVWYEDTFWDDIRVPGVTLNIAGERQPTLTKFKDSGSHYGVWVWHFDPDIVEDLMFTVQLPHSYKEGTDIYPHIHWSPTTVSGGNVKWALEYTWANVEDTYGDTSFISVESTSSGVAYKQQIANLGAIDGTGKKISSVLVGRFLRWATDGGDTYPHPAAFLEIDFHFEIDSPGSRETFVK